MDEKDFLQFISDSGMLDIATAKMLYDQMKNKKILEAHKYEVWQGTDGKWRTYVPKGKGRRMIVRVNKGDLEKDILEAYKEPKTTFKDCFELWIDQKIEYNEIQKQTYDRYTADYKRYFNGTEFEKKNVKEIDELYLEEFIKSKIASEHLTAKNWGNMRIIINGALIFARKHGYTDFRVTLFMSELQLSNRIFAKQIVKDEKQVFTDDEESKIENYINANPDMMKLGVALTFDTGLRVGEVSALKWSDYMGDFLSVTRTEIKYIGEHGERIADVRESTKGRYGQRQVVLSDNAIAILEKLKEYTGDSEWMFARNGQRIKAKWLSLEITKLCKDLKIPHRSFHKIRKTYATKLLKAGIGEEIVKKQMGHTEILTTKTYYYFNNEQVTDIRTKLNKVNQS